MLDIQNIIDGEVAKRTDLGHKVDANFQLELKNYINNLKRAKEYKDQRRLKELLNRYVTMRSKTKSLISIPAAEALDSLVNDCKAVLQKIEREESNK
jgi:hypothetical protein